MRIDFPDLSEPALAPLVERIVAERGGMPDLYRLLLHSPPFAEGWLTLLTRVRQQGCLPGAIRELAIIRVGLLNGAAYEAEQHRPIALVEGASEAQLAALAQWRDADMFDETERAVLGFVDAITSDIRVKPADFAAVRARFDDRALVELAVTAAAYNMVSRLLEAFELHAEGDGPAGEAG